MNKIISDTLLKQKLCLSCMRCCKIVAFPTCIKESDSVKIFYETRGFKSFMDVERDILFIVADIPCPHLTEKGCDIYRQRPLICRTYDGRHDVLLKYECKWNDLGKKAETTIFDISEEKKE